MRRAVARIVAGSCLAGLLAFGFGWASLWATARFEAASHLAQASPAPPEPAARPPAQETAPPPPAPAPAAIPRVAALAPEDGQPLSFRLLASEKRLPQDLKGPDIIIKLAEDATAYRQQWQWFQLESTPPAIDWAAESVLFVGLGESGSCPVQLAGLSLRDNRLLLAHVAYAGGYYTCTSDFTPRTFVVTVSKSALPAGPLEATIKNKFGEPRLRLR